MDAKEFFSKGWPTRLAFYLGKYLPWRAGETVAKMAARTLATLKPEIYWVTRANLRHVVGPDVSDQALQNLAYEVFCNAARGYYELFHNVGRGELDLTKFRPPVYLIPEAHRNIKEALDSGRGLFVVGCHMSNFDLAGAALAHYMSIQAQALSLADPTPGFELFNRLREEGGWGEITPICPEALRKAMRRLQDGGVVVTGGDRPTGKGDAPVEFFGVTAYLPAGYIRIPMRTDSLVITLAVMYEDDAYWIHTSAPMEMLRTGDRERDVVVNVQRVLADFEAFIRRHPEQWMMFVPVWREGNCE